MYTHSRNWRRRFGLAAVTGLIAATAATTAVADVTPSAVEATLAPGESIDVTKEVVTPTSSPRADVYFLADTTGSMGSAIFDVQNAFDDIVTQLTSAGEDIAFGAGDYKDFPFDPYAFQNSTPITDDGGTAASATAASWFASGGADGSEGQFFALHELANGAAAFRADASKIIVWFGDAPGHDPICSAISGAATDITEASLTADLVDAGITVIAVSTPTGFASGLDDDPTISAGDYAGTCAIGGTAGQATRIAAATGGLHQSAPAPNEVANTILDAIEALPFTIAPVATCDDGLTMSFDPPQQTVNPGATATFTETISVASDAETGGLQCTVDWTLNGGSAGPDFVQQVTITVEAGGGEATCVDLVAAQHEVVGEVCVEDDGTDMTVTYTTIAGWELTETHLHVACDGTADDVPQTGSGNAIPGRFDHSEPHESTSEVSYLVEDCTAGTIAAHAMVDEIVDGEVVRTESAWGDGEDFRGRNWAMHFSYPVE